MLRPPSTGGPCAPHPCAPGKMPRSSHAQPCPTFALQGPLDWREKVPTCPGFSAGCAGTLASRGPGGFWLLPWVVRVTTRCPSGRQTAPLGHTLSLPPPPTLLGTHAHRHTHMLIPNPQCTQHTRTHALSHASTPVHSRTLPSTFASPEAAAPPGLCGSGSWPLPAAGSPTGPNGPHYTCIPGRKDGPSLHLLN